jgi:hypothetical protein
MLALLVLSLLILGCARVASPGDKSAFARSPNISGRVILRGVPPAEKVITMNSVCAELNTGTVTTRHYVVGEGGALADVFLYVKDAPATPARAGVTPVMEANGCQFQPYVLGVQTGQTMELRNNDPVLDNAHVLPKKSGNRERNIAFLTGKATPLSFDAAELFMQLKTDVHPWMYAYICVVDHPWFAVTDRKGNFTLPPGLPPGEYTLVATHRKAGEQTQRIRVSADGAVPVTFTFDVPVR